MEAKTKYYITIYILVLILTLIFVRVSAHSLHDKEAYKDNALQNNEKIKTITSFLRKTTNFDWHHIHLGIIVLISAGTLMLLGFISKSSVILISIGSSLIFDQILPLINLGNYFSTPMILSSLLIHLIFIESLLIAKTS
jgi:hypothetical protein|tara:strand:- start:445 stop:861 length:417 start_codon:yes stop_codon:yes gene_type:complete